MNRPRQFTLFAVLVLLAIAPLEFAQYAPPPPPPPPPPPVVPAGASASARRGGTGGRAGAAPTAADIAILNRAMREVLAAAAPESKKILDANPALAITIFMGGARANGRSSINSISPSQLDVLNNALRAVLAADSAASKQALAAHPTYNIFTTMTAARAGTNGSGRAATARGRAAAPAADIPTAAELTALNLSLENVLSKASPDAKRVYDAHPHYTMMDPAGPRAVIGRGVPASTISATGRSSASTPGGNGLGEGN